MLFRMGEQMKKSPLVRKTDPQTSRDTARKAITSEEIWVPAFGANGHYEVSNKGRVRSLPKIVNSRFKTRRLSGKILNHTFSERRRYAVVSLSIKCKSKTWRVNRLVLFSFIGKPPKGKNHAAHNDGDRTNNCLSNLRWASPKENESDKRRHGTYLCGEKVNFCKLNEQDVIKIIEENGRLSDIAKKFSTTKTNVCQIKNGHTWKHIERGPEKREGQRVWRIAK